MLKMIYKQWLEVDLQSFSHRKRFAFTKVLKEIGSIHKMDLRILVDLETYIPRIYKNNYS